MNIHAETCTKEFITNNYFGTLFFEIGGYLDILQMKDGMIHDMRTARNGQMGEPEMYSRCDSLTMAPTLYVAAGVSV